MKHDETFFKALRAQAEALVATRKKTERHALKRSVDELLHELEVYQIELEIQNEELRLTQQALQILHHRYRNLFEHAPLGYVELDPSGVVFEANRSVLDLLKVAQRAFINKPLMLFVEAADRDAFSVHLMAVLEAKAARRIELRLKPRKGEGFPAELYSVPFQDTERDAWCILTSIQDITARRQAEAARRRWEAALVESKEEAEAAARLKTSMLANMSHEIRSPLTAIVGFAEVLEEQTRGTHQEFAGLIKMSGQRLLETMNSVLDLARVEGQAPGSKGELIDVGSLVEASLRLFRQKAEQKGLWLRFSAPEEPVMLVLDGGGLHRIVMNLLTNAIKFTEQGGITVQVRADEEAVYLTVEDTGIGIAPGFMPHLFEAFQQESMGLDRNYEGSGLGLTITRKLAERMGGSIRVESEKGRGSLFEITFPRTPVGAPAGGEEAPRPPEAPHPAGPRPPREPGARPRLLLLEGDENAVRQAHNALDQLFQIDHVSTPESCLSYAARQRPHVVLLNVELGGEMSAIELLQALRLEQGFREIPFIALTSHAAPSERERFLASGFDGYMSKTLAPRTLQRALQVAMHLIKLPEAEKHKMGYDWKALLGESRRSSLVDSVRPDRDMVTIVSGAVHFRLAPAEAARTLQAIQRSAQAT